MQVYSDVSGGTYNPFLPSLLRNFVTEWISGNPSQTILWSSTENEDVVFHSVTLQTQTTFKEISNQSEWGTLYYAMLAVSGSHLFAFSLTFQGVGTRERSYVPDRIVC